MCWKIFQYHIYRSAILTRQFILGVLFFPLVLSWINRLHRFSYTFLSYTGGTYWFCSAVLLTIIATGPFLRDYLSKTQRKKPQNIQWIRVLLGVHKWVFLLWKDRRLKHNGFVPYKWRPMSIVPS